MPEPIRDSVFVAVLTRVASVIADRVAVTMATVEVASSWADLRDRQLH